MAVLNTKRINFLENQWLAYPKFDPSSKYWGRFKSINEANEVELLSYQEDHFFNSQIVQINKVQNLSFWQEVLVPGDIVAVSEKVELTLLTPNLAPGEMSEYIPSPKWTTLDLWAEYIRLVRSFFNGKKFLELSTPLIVNHPGSEPTLEPFKISLKRGSQLTDKYLPTSPELNLKKVLTTGVPRVFEITKSFRNNEDSERHCPEFWILEWYRNFSNLDDIKQDVKELVLFLQQQLGKYLENKPTNAVKLNIDSQFCSQSFQKIFQERYQFKFLPTTNQAELKEFCLTNKIDSIGVNSIEDLFSVITFEKIEPQLDINKITFLEKYPPYAAALARKDDQGWAERFEVYWQGLELANAFFELNDVHEQRLRFLKDNQQKKENSLEEIALDEDFLYRLSTGMPPCSGIALGLERLFMALFNIEEIKALKL